MATARRRLLWLLLIPVLLAGGFFLLRGRGEATQFTTGTIDRGDVVEVVGATGILEAVTTVQLGSQVSGTIKSLHADFNSTVKKGQVVARLDPSIFDARLGQAQANLLAAKANVERARSTVEDMRQKYARAKELATQKLLPTTELETAKANFDGAVAQVKASEAAESQSQASVNQAKLDLSHTIIDTPIDGVVISRNVDVGQTVAASFQAPVLFVIANDLAQMRVNAAVDEADVGRVREGQEVVFHVDAFPEREFKGAVEQVRLNPTTVSNVVSYNTIVAVDNRDLLLRPGMTATVSIVVRKAENALRLPAAALRFRPEGFQRPTGAWRAEPPRAPGQAGAAGGAPRCGRAALGWGGPAASGPRAAARGSVLGGADRGGPGGGRGPGRPTTVFVPDEKGQPKPVEVRIGVSDGQFVEVREGLVEGALVITGTEIPGARAAGAGPRPGTSPVLEPLQSPAAAAAAAIGSCPSPSSGWSTSSAPTRSGTSPSTPCAA